MRSRRSALLLVALAVVPSLARAQDGQQQRMVAEHLFNEGRELMQRGELAEACERFARSNKLDAAVGTLLNLAECTERRGDLATAWGTYAEAATLAAQRKDERVAFARDRAGRLEGLVPKVVVRLAPRSTPEEARVQLDGAPLDPGLLGIPVPLNPGVHTISAFSGSAREWNRSFELRAGGPLVTVDVPDGRSDETRGAADAPPVAVGEARAIGPREVGYGVAAAGVVGLALGGYFGLRAASKWSSVEDRCPGGACADAATLAEQQPTRDAAGDLATAATISLIAGGVALAAGIVLVLLTPRSGGSTARATTVRRAPGLGLTF